MRLLRPTHAHSVFSATVVLTVSTFLSRIIGLVRVKYIMLLFGSGVAADALTAAFVLPDMISYFLVGGTAVFGLFAIIFILVATGLIKTGRPSDQHHTSEHK